MNPRKYEVLVKYDESTMTLETRATWFPPEEKMDSKNCDSNKHLQKFREKIPNYSLKRPKIQRIEEENVEYLYNALIEAEYANPALTGF